MNPKDSIIGRQKKCVKKNKQWIYSGRKKIRQEKEIRRNEVERKDDSAV